MTLPRPYIPAAIIVAMVILAMTATIASQPGVGQFFDTVGKAANSRTAAQ